MTCRLFIGSVIVVMGFPALAKAFYNDRDVPRGAEHYRQPHLQQQLCVEEHKLDHAEEKSLPDALICLFRGSGGLGLLMVFGLSMVGKL